MNFNEVKKDLKPEIKKESKLFNKCVAEIIEDGGTNSEAVRYCNGGN